MRIAGYGYQQGFGGHFHNDNGVAVLRDIPGLVIASPAHPADAPAMLRTCVAAAVVDGTVSVFLEPIARYHTRDLHVPGDEGWTAPYAPPTAWAHEHIPIGAPAIVRDGDDVLVVTWGNGRFLAQRAAERLAADGVGCRILDVRWLAPLPVDEIVRHAVAVGRVLVVDETRRSGGPGEAIMAALADGRVRRPGPPPGRRRLVRPARRRRPPRPRVRGRHRVGCPGARRRELGRSLIAPAVTSERFGPDPGRTCDQDPDRNVVRSR